MTPLPTHIHLIGIGGMGMAPLALYLQQTGIRVSGEDDAPQQQVTELLESNGVTLSTKSKAKRSLERAPMVVYSNAIKHDDPRLVYAREQGKEVLLRGQLLARIVADRKLIAVVGSHGKTTTAGMLAWILRKSGVIVDSIIGGFYKDVSVLPALYMGSEWVIAEVDESDGTIDQFAPEIMLLTNADWDHPDQYASAHAFEEALIGIVHRTHRNVFAPAEWLSRFSKQTLSGEFSAEDGLERDLISYSLHTEAQYMGSVSSVAGDRIDMKVWLQGQSAKQAASYSLACYGEFNAQNALAAYAVAHQFSDAIPMDGWADFPGMLRRQQKLYEQNGLEMVADYAHHPVEMKALLAVFLQRCSQEQIGVVFQPHRYTRTRAYASAFAEVLDSFQHVALLPVYAASESHDPEGDTEAIRRAGSGTGNMAIVEDSEALFSLLDNWRSKLRVILFIGAGDIDVSASEYVKRLESGTTTTSLHEREDSNANWANAGSGDTFWEKVCSRLSRDTQLIEYKDLSKKTTIRVGGAARFYAEPASQDDLQMLLQLASEHRIPCFFLGRGSNLLVHDEGFPGLVIHLNHPNWKRIQQIDDERLEVGAAVRLQALSSRVSKWGMDGFAFLEGIPGSVGGALRMNAGAMGGWMFDLVEEVSYLTMDGAYRRAAASELHAGYRNCEELIHGVAMQAILRSPGHAQTDAIQKTMKEFAHKRVNTQPKDPSAGCIFRNPVGDAAGRIIDELGLKGTRIGQAQISDIHGNFIVNLGKASSKDIIDLIRVVRQRVKESKGLELQPELMLLGKTWEEVL